MFYLVEFFVNPWSTSIITDLLQKIKAELSKYKVRDLITFHWFLYIINNAIFNVFFAIHNISGILFVR